MRSTKGNTQKPPESFLNQPIRSLQTMLRTLSEFDDRHDTVVPDGIYGPATVSAVSKFQRIHGLPVTGVTDHATWEAVVAEYDPAFIAIAEAEMLDIILEPNRVLRQGEQHPHVYLVQSILQVLQDAYGSIGPLPHTGILDGPTIQAITAFQELSALPMTGNVDKRTWKHLALHYPQAARLADR